MAQPILDQPRLNPDDPQLLPGGTRNYNHDLLIPNPRCTPSAKKKDSYRAKVDIRAGDSIFTDNATLVATTFADNPAIEAIMQDAYENRSGGPKKNKAWLGNREELNKHPDWKSVHGEYAMPLHSLRSPEWNGPTYEKIGLFRYMALFRHSCLPSAHLSYDPKTNMGYLHAMRDIAIGEEVTISFLPESAYDDNKFKDANDVLLRTFQRRCDCPVHAVEGVANAAQFDFAKVLHSRFFLKHKIYNSYEEELALLFDIHQDYCKYGIVDARKARVLEEALECACFHGDAARATVFAAVARFRYRLLEGINGLKVLEMEKYHSDVTKHPSFNAAGSFRTNRSEIVQAEAGREFNRTMFDWLWIQKKWKGLSLQSDEYKKLAEPALVGLPAIRWICLDDVQQDS